jgi:hypothetical protein
MTIGQKFSSRMGATICAVSIAVTVSAATSAFAQPAVPVGLDAYRMWDRWPYQRIGVRAYMRSTYDRTGGNEGADASHFLYQERDDFNVSLDVEGSGVLYFVRTNHWHGSPWHYEIDGKDNIVQESSTADPDHPVENSIFLPQSAFPNPLTWTWSDTKGADLMWVPIPFEKSLRLAYSRTRYGTGYYIYHQFVEGTPLTSPIKSWDVHTAPDTDVVHLIQKSGTPLVDLDSLPQNLDPKVDESANTIARRSATVFQCSGKRMIRAIEIDVPRDKAIAFGRATIRAWWDGRKEPSIESPVALFFGAGTLYNRDDREYLVKAFPMNIRYAQDRVHLACYFPMPFFESAKWTIAAPKGATFENVNVGVLHTAYNDSPAHVGYFHATHKEIPTPKQGHDMVALDTKDIEGESDWSGHFTGMSWIFSHAGVLNTLEGDPRFFFDDSQTPQAYGTGTEEWGGGGDYWGGENMTLPFAGHPCGARKAEDAKDPEDLIESAYRFLLADLMPFGKRAVIRLEHGGENMSREHYAFTSYWYGLPAPSLVLTDELDVGDLNSERKHQYDASQTSEPESISSRYEWGIDTIRAGRAGNASPIEIYPEHSETGRHTTKESSFVLTLRPNNEGVLLRRSLDYMYPNQRAEIYVADVSDSVPKWELAGVWYTAGSNTCVYSNPKEELGATLHNAQTSNRRFRDDEFLVPKRLTQGRDAIRVRVEFTPVERPLFAGHPMQPLAWSELGYKAYCFVAPEFAP